MRISIGWSGNLSHRIAVLLGKWLPAVVQAVTPLVSPDESKRGTAWFKALKDQHKQIDFAMICLTRENINAPWLLFEAGILSTRFDEAHLCALLIDDFAGKALEGPFVNFQSVKLADKEEMRKLIQKINQMHVTRMSSGNALNSAFDRRWPVLEDACKKAIHAGPDRKDIAQPKSERQLLEEINGLCARLVETMGAVSEDIKDVKNELIKQNIISFPRKEIRRS